MKLSTFSSAAPILRINPQDPDEEIIKRAASVMLAGGLVIYPTETFYALGAHPMLEKAVARVFEAKGRDFQKPLPLIASSVEAALRAVAEWPSVAERLARAFWPGPLTLILPASSDAPPLLHARTGKIAMRVSSHPIAGALAGAMGGLIISTSANPADHPACSDPEDFSTAFLAKVDGLLHAGPVPGQSPSTIVDLSSEQPRLVRAGCIPWEDVARMCDS